MCDADGTVVGKDNTILQQLTERNQEFIQRKEYTENIKKYPAMGCSTAP